MLIAGVFSMAIGALMIAQWTFSLVRQQVPELNTEPVRLLFHLVAELATAVVLMAGGLGLLTGRAWGPPVHLLSMGMLLYTLMASCGYFAQRRVWSMAAMFALLFAFTLGDLCFIVPSLTR
jgi:hypothetical protein